MESTVAMLVGLGHLPCSYLEQGRRIAQVPTGNSTCRRPARHCSNASRYARRPAIALVDQGHFASGTLGRGAGPSAEGAEERIGVLVAE